MRWFIHSKWLKTKALISDPVIERNIPETQLMELEHVNRMLENYGMVYVKPDKGTYGNGVIRVERTEEGFLYQKGLKTRSFTNVEELFHDLIRVTRGRRYLVQRGIGLLQFKGRRFDIRVMVQRNLAKQWETTGVIGRVADPRKIVTNVHNGGTLKPVTTLMNDYMGLQQQKQFMQGLRELGLAVARQLERSFPGIRELGLDVAVDQQMNCWILEVNTCPDPYIFRGLKDKSVFRRVYRYAKAYGRIKSTERRRTVARKETGKKSVRIKVKNTGMKSRRSKGRV